MSVGVIKSTEGTEHSHVPGGGCFGEYLFININAVRWDGQTIENTACVPFFFPGLHLLRTGPTIVIAHTFCASPDTRISYRQCLLI